MSEPTVIQATLTEDKGGPRECEAKYDFGANLQEAIDQFGDEVIFNNFVAQAKINIQALMRRCMTPDKEGATKSDAEIQAMVDAWKPGAKTVQRKSTVEKARELMGGMTKEQKLELLRALQEDYTDGAEMEGDATEEPMEGVAE